MARWARFTIFAIGLAITSNLIMLCFGDDQKDNRQPGESGNKETEFSDDVKHPDHLWVEDEDFEDSPLLPVHPVSKQMLANKTQKSSLLLVSTLDGKLQALDADNEGELLWKIDTEPGGLLSSSISKVELNSQGKLVRLIPSLDGGLYKFDGEAIEPIPITADSLLHSSFRAADDLLITGGKELRTYGVDFYTGEVQYACSASGCDAQPPTASSTGLFLIVRRHSQIVRAIEPRTGTERWNFSVGRHEVSLIKNGESLAECKKNHMGAQENKHFMNCLNEHLQTKEEDQLSEPLVKVTNKADMNFKLVVPDGVVCAMNPERPGSVLWKFKFESPIVNVWRLIDEKLVPLDIFNSDFIPALDDKPSATEAVTSPLLYVGIHNNQLYVQESTQMINRIDLDIKTGGNALQSTSFLDLSAHRLRWRPLLVTSLITEQARPGRFTVSSSPTSDDNSSEKSDNSESTKSLSPEITALIVRHDTDSPDRGFYLYGLKDGKNENEQSKLKEIKNDDDEPEELWEGGKDTSVHFVIVSLWFWWREVVFISLITAFVFHMIITRQVVYILQREWAIQLHDRVSAIVTSLNRPAIGNVEDQQPVPQNALVATNIDQLDATSKMESVVVVDQQTTPQVAGYVSRYLDDFEAIQCLGRGGFGLVFEVRNRLDDQHYAVKRIQLPNSEEAREKVMREVKALAKLDNPHIVRYFHAWIECPPPGWQEREDAAWIDSESLNGPTPFNSGEEESSRMTWSNFLVEQPSALSISSSEEEASFEPFQMSHVVKSIDLVSKNRKRDKFMSEDSSFDVVFEDSKRGQQSSIESKNQSVIDFSATKADESESIQHSRKHPRKNMDLLLRTPINPTINEAKMYLFIQMQLCRKESLREWLRSHISHRDTNQILHMFNEIVAAVEYVHTQGLIHRDLKPSNIFFAPANGAIKIGDFGLVTAMAEESYFHSPTSAENSRFNNPGFSPFQRTHTDQVGTQMYMSPEQIEGKPYNHKVDIYSLGLIFVELLWPLATQMEQVTVISQLRKLIFPKEFEATYPEETILLRKMLSRNPDERPTTYGIRASKPLAKYQDSSIAEFPEYLHYNLLQRPRSASTKISTSE